MRLLPLLLLAGLAPGYAAPALDVLLPPGATAVLGLRTSALLNLLAQQDGAGAIKMQLAMAMAATPFAGFDPFRDIEELVIATTGSGQNPPTLAVVTGHFNATQLASLKGQPYRNATLFADPKSKSVLALLDETTLLGGDAPLVKAAIDRASGNVAAGPLAARIEELRGRYDIWVLADHLDAAAAGKALPLAAGPGAAMLNGLDRLWLGASFSTNFELAAELHLHSAQQATAFTALLHDLEKQAKSNAAMSSGTFDLHASGDSVKIAISIPEEQWKKALKEQLQPQARAQTDTRPRVFSTEPRIVSTDPQAQPKPQVITTDGAGNTVTLSLPGKRQ